MDVLILIIRLVLFAVFALAGVGKFVDLKGSEKAVKDFGTPDEFAKAFAVMLPFAEIVFAFCFLFPSTAWVGAIGGLILLLTFTGGMIWQMSQGRAPDCHCFGQIHSEPVSRKTLVRNIIFSLLAVFLIFQGRDNQGMALSLDPSDSMQLILIFLLLVLTTVALFYLKKMFDQMSELLRRVELLEVVSREGMPLERSDAGHPQDGLPVGAPFPAFELTDTSGRDISLDSVFANRRPSIFLFVSPTCDPCKALLPEMEKWQAELGERVNFVLLSSGTAEANREKFAGVFADEIILQKKREIAEAVHARWTPTAIFVRSDATIGSAPAAGDAAIRTLIDKVRREDVLQASLHFAGTHSYSGREHQIGEGVPDFNLRDANDNEITAGEFRRGKKTLAVFWSLTCPHCTAMMDDLKAWDAVRNGNEPELIVFSDGDPEKHQALGLNAPIVIDPGYKVAETIGMFGTPSAVLIDEDGRIASETGTGAPNIWALVGKRK